MDNYLRYLDEGLHSVQLVSSDLAPKEPVLHPESVAIPGLGYTITFREFMKSVAVIVLMSLAVANVLLLIKILL